MLHTVERKRHKKKIHMDMCRLDRFYDDSYCCQRFACAFHLLHSYRKRLTD